ncbi:MAG: MFS transporter [Gammaproteobacteria bacterium]|jgi:fucose permease|nr:MFS transporter [Gammaproteobacteria bacterium]MCP4881524.1 MFS transporter [Gammaproteobacteria bacterium]MDP6165588.1 MFS transporter [Gammaproteobacteria bacterium]
MSRQSSILIALSFVAFISLGLPDGLLGVAWPGIRNTFALPLDALGLLVIFFTSGYMLASFFSGALIRHLGIGGLLSASCATTAAALLIYAITPVWWLFVLASTIGGLGAGAIDAGINSYVDKNHSERVMQWLHASFGIGVTLGPIIMTLGITLTASWQAGYVFVVLAQALLALVFLVTRNMWQGTVTVAQVHDNVATEAPLIETIKTLPALLSMFMFFIYVGVELGLGLWAYSLLTIARNIDPQVAGFVTGSYWAMFTIGRILAGWYTHRMTASAILYISILAAMVGTLIVAINMGTMITITGIALIGFSIAPIFPCLISDTQYRVGPNHVTNTIGMQIAAAGFGGAVIPSLAGVLARIYSLEIVPYYLFVALLMLLASFMLSHHLSLKAARQDCL